jgi:hypothetical protein
MNAGIGASQINSPQEPDPVHRDVELKENQTALTSANDLAIRRALESAGVEFIDENAGDLPFLPSLQNETSVAQHCSIIPKAMVSDWDAR